MHGVLKPIVLADQKGSPSECIILWVSYHGEEDLVNG